MIIQKSYQNPSKNLSFAISLAHPWFICGCEAPGAFRLAHADEAVLRQIIDGRMAAAERRG
jgi:hypothetical protein